MVVIYAWKFTSREGLASIPKNDHDGGLSENIDDTCSESTMTGGNVSECTDELAYRYEWEDKAARDLGLRTCAASPKVDCPKGDYPKMPCVPAEEHHREKVVKVAKFINAMVSRSWGGAWEPDYVPDVGRGILSRSGEFSCNFRSIQMG